MGTITYKTEDSATTPNPPSGSVQTGVDYTTGEPYYKDAAGVVHSLKGGKGDKGDEGDKGDTGPAATITVGTTTTGAPGTDASVSNTGTSSAAVFNFTIPRGEPGVKGDDGDPGDDGAAATIAVGTVTTVESTDPATVSNSGTSSAAVFDFGIPKGAPGEQGPAGADGHILDASDLGSITGSITVDLSSAHVFTATLTGDVTLAWSGLPASGTMTDRVLILTQDATGDHAITWPSGTKWPGGLAYTTDAANIETAVGLLVDSAGNTRAFPVEDFS